MRCAITQRCSVYFAVMLTVKTLIQLGVNKMNTFKTVQDVQAYLDGFSKNGLDGRDLMRAVGQETMMNMIAVRGASAVISAWLGFSNSGVLSVATADLGWRIAGTRGPSGSSGTVKVKGSLPYKTAFAVAKVIGLEPDPEEFDAELIGWQEFKLALEQQGSEWLELLFRRLGGRESDGGKSFTAWIDSNKAADDLAAKKADPLYQAKESIRAMQTIIRDKEIEIDSLKSEIAELERRIAAGPRKTNGGILTSAMKKLMIQRFHPDKQNGNDPEIYNTLAQWINALEPIHEPFQ